MKSTWIFLILASIGVSAHGASRDLLNCQQKFQSLKIVENEGELSMERSTGSRGVLLSDEDGRFLIRGTDSSSQLMIFVGATVLIQQKNIEISLNDQKGSKLLVSFEAKPELNEAIKVVTFNTESSDLKKAVLAGLKVENEQDLAFEVEACQIKTESAVANPLVEKKQ